MNKRQVIVLWIIALVLAAAVGLVKLTTKDATSSATKRAPGETLFDSFPATDAAKIVIAGADATVTVQRKGDGWVVVERDEFPARLLMVNEFLRTLTDLKVTQGVEAGPSFAPRFGMDEAAKNADDRGITATFHDAGGKETAKVSLGKHIESGGDTGMMGGSAGAGRYVRNHADESGFYAVSEMFPSITPEFALWLDNAFINPEKISTISVTEKAADTTAWKVLRDSEDAEFKLEHPAPGEVLESSASTAFKSLLAFARFDDLIPATDAVGRSDPSGKRKVVIETFEGFTYQLEIAPVKGTEDALAMTINVSAGIAKERMPEEGESAEDAKAKADAFATRATALQEKLTKESKLNGRTFQLTKSAVEAVLKDRGEIIAKAEAPAPGAGAQGSVQQTPGGLIATPPVQAVTEPVEIPVQEE